MTYVNAWGIATTNGQAGLIGIGSGKGIDNLKEILDDKADKKKCEADLGQCFYSAPKDFIGCIWSYIGDLLACL
jgi:hypothetical protein